MACGDGKSRELVVPFRRRCTHTPFSPVRIATLQGQEPCENRQREALATLFPSVSELRKRLQEIINTKTSNAHSTALQLSKLKQLRKEASLTNDRQLKSQIKLRLAEEEFLDNFYKGVAALEKKAARLPMICDLIQHRQHQTADLEVIFNRSASVYTHKGKEDAWLSNSLAANARLVRRADDRNFSETHDSVKEAKKREEERVQQVLNKSVNRLIHKDEKGPEALFIYAPFKCKLT